MKPTLEDLIPGAREAEERYRSAALEAFAGIEPRILGILEIKPLEPYMLLDLIGGENAFVFGIKDPGPEDVAVLLWRCSPIWEPGNDDLRRLYQSSLATFPFDGIAEECAAYIQRSLAGAPAWGGGSGKGRASVGSWPSRLVHMFGAEYGWSEEYTLSRPFRRLWQYANRVLEAHDQKYRERVPEVMALRVQFLKNANAGGRPAGGS